MDPTIAPIEVPAMQSMFSYRDEKIGHYRRYSKPMILNVFDKFRIEKQISPIELAKLERQKRQRARNTGKNDKTESKW